MDKMKTVLYFGYGSNMSTQYLIKRRKIIPLESQAAFLEDYQLIMNMEGPNFLEPSFANIRPYEGSSVEGVIHKIDERDLQSKRKKAYSLIYKTEETKDIPPSKRYLKILIRAAKENNLSNNYIESLERRPNVYYPILSEIFSLRVYLWVWLRT